MAQGESGLPTPIRPDVAISTEAPSDAIRLDQLERVMSGIVDALRVRRSKNDGVGFGAEIADIIETSGLSQEQQYQALVSLYDFFDAFKPTPSQPIIRRPNLSILPNSNTP